MACVPWLAVCVIVCVGVCCCHASHHDGRDQHLTEDSSVTLSLTPDDLRDLMSKWGRGEGEGEGEGESAGGGSGVACVRVPLGPQSEMTAVLPNVFLSDNTAASTAWLLRVHCIDTILTIAPRSQSPFEHEYSDPLLTHYRIGTAPPLPTPLVFFVSLCFSEEISLLLCYLTVRDLFGGMKS
jgi:hypothetical protein